MTAFKQIHKKHDLRKPNLVCRQYRGRVYIKHDRNRNYRMETKLILRVMTNTIDVNGFLYFSRSCETTFGVQNS